MPFNVSNPVLYYNRQMFEAAGLDPDVSPVSLDDLRATSQTIVDSGAASYGWVVDSGADSGGGWFLEQWLGRAGELYADNGNGRIAPATKVVYDGQTGIDLLTFVQSMINDGLAVNGRRQPRWPGCVPEDDRSGAARSDDDRHLGGARQCDRRARRWHRARADRGRHRRRADARAWRHPRRAGRGGSLWIVADKGDAQTAAAWDFITYLVSAEIQSRWASETGYVPVRSDAVDLEPLVTKYATDPRFTVPYDQLLTSVEGEASLSPVLGPQREVRVATANAVAAIFGGADVATSLSAAAAQSNALIDELQPAQLAPSSGPRRCEHRFPSCRAGVRIEAFEGRRTKGRQWFDVGSQAVGIGPVTGNLANRVNRTWWTTLRGQTGLSVTCR